MMHNTTAHHPSTAVQPVPRGNPCQGNPSFIVQYDVILYAISLWPAQVSCPGSVPSQLPVHSQLLKAEAAQEAEKSLIQYKYYSATTNISVCYQYHSLPKSTALHYISSQEEGELYPGQKQYRKEKKVHNKNQHTYIYLAHDSIFF